MNRELRAIAVEEHAIPAVLYAVVAPMGLGSLYFSGSVAWWLIEAVSYAQGALWTMGSALIGAISVGCIGRSRREWRAFKQASAAAHTPKSIG